VQTSALPISPLLPSGALDTPSVGARSPLELTSSDVEELSATLDVEALPTGSLVEVAPPLLVTVGTELVLELVLLELKPDVSVVDELSELVAPGTPDVAVGAVPEFCDDSQAANATPIKVAVVKRRGRAWSRSPVIFGSIARNRRTPSGRRSGVLLRTLRTSRSGRGSPKVC